MQYPADYIDMVICGDCLEVMKSIPDGIIGMILCDLPYGITRTEWDNNIPLLPLWDQYKRIIKPNAAILLTATQPFAAELIMSNPAMFRYEWIWEKTSATGYLHANRMPMRAHENILVFYGRLPIYNPQKEKGAPSFQMHGKKRMSSHYDVFGEKPYINPEGWRYPRSVIKFGNANRPNSPHPCWKPVSLFEYLIKTYTKEGDIVLDNCIGGGTTAVAAKKSNRHYVGIEINEEYCEVARKRLAELDMDLFASKVAAE